MQLGVQSSGYRATCAERINALPMNASKSDATLDRQPKNATVVLVHGLWMKGPFMQMLAWHLRRYGYQTRCVSYDFLSKTPAQNAQRLADALDSITTPTVHWLAHSLGGIVWLHYINSPRGESNPSGRCVLLGSPVQGSSIARRLHQNRFLKLFLGRSVDHGLLGGAPMSIGKHRVGLIRGSCGRFSASYWLNRGSEASDAVVLHAETELDGVQDITQVPSTHSAMVFSATTARRAAEFFAHGEFSNTG